MHRADTPARVLSDRYELHVRRGSGGAGTVWRGHDRALDRPVAIKLLHGDLADDPVAESRFHTEATAAARVTHPHAVQVYDVGRDGNDDYLVMELLDGPSLADVLRDGPLAPGLVSAVGAMVAGALGAAHTAGIVHRDVKPANVLFTPEGSAKLADFGVARVLGSITSRLTRTGMVLGTARYLAPEQLRDDDIDARADVYALGVVLHEAITGQPPFGEGTSTEIATRRLATALPPIGDLIPDVPLGLEEVVRWAVSIDPADRPPNGDEFASALRPFAAHDARASLARIVHGHRPLVRSAGVVSVDTATQAMSPLDATTPVPQPSDVPRQRHTSDEPGSAPLAPPPVPGGHGTFGENGENGERRDTTTPLDDDWTPRQAPRQPADGGPIRRRNIARRWVVAAVAALTVTLAGLMTVNGWQASSDAEDGDGGSDRVDAPADTPVEPAGDSELLAFTSAGDHDPPPGDQSERGDSVDRAIDGDPQTFWPSESYNSADLGGFPKDGVGLWARLDEPVFLDRIELTLSRAGGAVQVWAGDGAPAGDQHPEQWGELLGEREITGDEVVFGDLEHEITADTVLVWFTDLPPGGNGYRVELRELQAHGR